MQSVKNRKEATRKRHLRIRKKLSGTPDCPRLAVYRSVKHISVQLIDDVNSVTLVSASSLDKEIRAKVKHGGNIDAARVVGEFIATRAKAKGVGDVVFDRGGNLYHGRVAALAEAAREGGLNF